MIRRQATIKRAIPREAKSDAEETIFIPSELWHAVAYGTTACGCVHDKQLHNYLTLLCCKQINKKVHCFVNANVNGKSATSMSR
jgi:hypothetical protein